ncbi:uncharacterized protein K02A2.6-like [Uranotaenia lowii]|uniref:uncharacterized protein K02A2.6-like n=1 Tax=Uranotaenia lowii TaxID=190385 RepID=UPI00247A8C1A|nr:uncharacterized protein K02A2.6-like [Uranotaenia lowii]
MDRWDLPPFIFKGLPQTEVREKWVRYKRQFDYMALANATTNKIRLKNIFLSRAGPDVQEVFSSIPGADVEERLGVDPFQVMIQKLDQYFAPKEHEAYQRLQFWMLKPKEKDESFDKFLLRTAEMTNMCNFGNSLQESREISVIDKLIQTAAPDLREKILQQENLNIYIITKLINAHEAVKFQSQQFTAASTNQSSELVVNRIQGLSRNVYRPNFRNEYQNTPRGTLGTSFRNSYRDDLIACGKCGYKDQRHPDRRCPALDRNCLKCGKQGHFLMFCPDRYRSRKRQVPHQGNNFRNNRFKRPAINAVDTEENDESGNFLNYISNSKAGEELLWVTIGGVMVQVLIDSGCQYNIIDDTTWNKMLAEGVEHEEQHNKDKTFRVYGKHFRPLVTRTVFEAVISIEDDARRIQKTATFYVINEGSQPLLGRATAKELGVLVLGLPSSREMFDVCQLTCSKQVFPKIRGIQLRISIDPSVTPVCQSVRRPPLALLTKIEEKLHALLASDIIEPVQEYSPWVSPLVTILKDNGDLRLCVDMRRANMAIKREAHPMPTFDDFLPRLKKARVFSRLDIKESFYQMELHKDSRHITTFITHLGIFRFKRLMFGISCAPEMFQKGLEQILVTCNNTINFIDDILIFGENLSEHDKELDKTLATLRTAGVLLNHEKCVVSLPSRAHLRTGN